MYNLTDLFKLLELSELYFLGKSLRKYGLELYLSELQNYIFQNYEPVHAWYMDYQLLDVESQNHTIGALVYVSDVSLELLEVFAVMPITIFMKLKKRVLSSPEHFPVVKVAISKLYESYLCLNKRNRRALVG